MTTDEKYMARCLQLAANGRFDVPPNPMVGAIIVCDGKIIGEGYHRQCGGPHAEVNAVRSVKNGQLLRKSTMYVSLEPCAHYGKTPPCADMIIEKGIPRVVVGCRDSFDQVDGQGIQRLREAGVEVIVGVLERECLDLNRAFFTYHGRRRPYIILKWAQSTDGYIDAKRSAIRKQQSVDMVCEKPVRFSTDETIVRVHRQRALSDAILVGRRTAELDNPALTTRAWPGRNPLRLVIDRRAVLERDMKLFDGTVKTIVFTEIFQDFLCMGNIEQMQLDFSKDILSQMMGFLHAHGVQRLLVEGGARLLQSCIDNGLWDEAFVEEAPFELGSGVKAPCLSDGHREVEFESFGNHFSIFMRKTHLLI